MLKHIGGQTNLYIILLLLWMINRINMSLNAATERLHVIDE